MNGFFLCLIEVNVDSTMYGSLLVSCMCNMLFGNAIVIFEKCVHIKISFMAVSPLSPLPKGWHLFNIWIFLSRSILEKKNGKKFKFSILNFMNHCINYMIATDAALCIHFLHEWPCRCYKGKLCCPSIHWNQWQVFHNSLIMMSPVPHQLYFKLLFSEHHLVVVTVIY